MSTDLYALPYSRKPVRWREVHTAVPASALPPDLPRYHAFDLGIEVYALGDFQIDPGAPFFLVEVGADVYLIKTEGAGYARYATKVVS